MAQVNWSFQALEDLSDIAEFLAKNSENYASRIVSLILVKVENLKKFPRLGRIVPETNLKSIRELVVKNYRIIYTISSKGEVFILAIRHSAISLDDFPLDV